jgi:hypothetical protein
MTRFSSRFPSHAPRPTAPHQRRRFAPALAQAAVGTVGTAAVVCAGLFVFGPFSDLSTLQLAAGPLAVSGAGSQPAAIVMAPTGRAWGEAAQQRLAAAAAAAASAPVAQLARRDGAGVR